MTHLVRSSLVLRLAAFAVVLGALAVAGCAGDETDSAPEPVAGAPAVEYEAAYPEEVSREELTADDAGQQEAAHSHGDETHVHDGDDDHMHDGDDDHPHDGDEDHGPDGHSH
jgi:hypothetical protein